MNRYVAWRQRSAENLFSRRSVCLEHAAGYVCLENDSMGKLPVVGFCCELVNAAV